jgi:hypothetical protein
MKKIRCSLATIVLLTLGGLSLFQGMGSISLANATSSHYASSVSATSVVGKSLAFKIKPPCGSAFDC